MSVPKVTFVWPAANFSVWDVARGYRNALGRALGEDAIQDYFLDKHSSYHQRALPMEMAADAFILSKYATESVLNEALYFGADIVLVVSGLNFHPCALWLLHRVGVHAAAILTESPYEDESQSVWAQTYPEMTVFTNERISAKRHGWNYLKHAYDPAVHQEWNQEINFHDECDVVMVGTGWKDRQDLLEQVDWTGIDLRLYGLWPEMDSSSPLYKFLWPVCVDNTLMPQHYSAAKVCLNLHRKHKQAESMNPRAYELAACGRFQICDDRQEVEEVFGDAVPTFQTAGELEDQIRWSLAHPEMRQIKARRAQELVRQHSFDARVQQLLETITTSAGFLNSTRSLVSV